MVQLILTEELWEPLIWFDLGRHLKSVLSFRETKQDAHPPNGGTRQNATSLSLTMWLISSRLCHWTTSNSKHLSGTFRIFKDKTWSILWNTLPTRFRLRATAFRLSPKIMGAECDQPLLDDYCYVWLNNFKVCFACTTLPEARFWQL